MSGLIIAGIMSALCVLVHTEALIRIDRFVDRLQSFRLSLLFTWAGY